MALGRGGDKRSMGGKRYRQKIEYLSEIVEVTEDGGVRGKVVIAG